MTKRPEPSADLDDPATFQARGVAMPFTAPVLAAARARASDRGTIELIVPSPSGGRGSYVIDWEGARAVASPTMHDTRLYAELRTLRALRPRQVREAALATAMQGYAGRAAEAAAHGAIRADRKQRARAHFLLLRGLVQQVDPQRRIDAVERTPDFDRAAGAVLQRLVPDLRRPATQLALEVATLSDAFGPIGLDPHDRSARLPRVVARLHDAVADLAAWSRADGRNDPVGLGAAVESALGATLKGAGAVIATTRKIMGDPLAMLRRRIADPAGSLALAERLDWLLDGWERLGLIWQAADGTAERREALQEIALALPRVPREARQWRNPRVDVPVPDQVLRIVASDGGARSGAAAVRAIARNESIRAMSL